MSNNNNNLGITTPLGIDLSNFSCTNDESSESNADIPLIIEIETPHKNVKNILQKRRDTLKKLSTYWQKGNISEAIKHLSSSKDLGVANDFFNFAFMKNEINKDYLKLDDSVAILSLVTGLVKSQHESNFKTGIKMVCMFFDMYSNTIKMVKRNRGVGASSEDTWMKYQQLIVFFESILKIESIRKRNLEKDKNLKALLEEMEEFVNSCNRN
jgi:hypothetical protein